jgi:urease accessory protein UreF
MTEIDSLRRALALMESLEASLAAVPWGEDERVSEEVRHAERRGGQPWHESLLEVMRDKVNARLRSVEKERSPRWPT